jgi:hypothetical protein
MRSTRTSRVRRIAAAAGILAAGWVAAGAPIWLGI